MSPKILNIEKEEKGDMIIIRRTLLNEIIGRIKQQLVITKDKIVHRSWSAWGYSEKSLKRIKTRDGKDAIDVVWGHEGEGRSDWYWTIIVPPDPRQIDQLFSAIKDYDTFGEIISRLHNNCLTKNVNKRVECDISFLFA